MIQPCVPHNIVQGTARTRPRISTSENKPADPGEYKCPGTHWAGFNGDVELSPPKVPRAEQQCRLSDGKYFRMGGRVFFLSVGGSGQHPPFHDNQRTYRNISPADSFSCLSEGDLHKIFVT